MPVEIPLLKKRRVIGIKLEAVPGTAETPAAADATLNCWDVDIQDDSEMVPRPGQGGFGKAASVTAGKRGTVKFKTDLVVTAIDPAWANLLLPTLGWIYAADTWSPSSLGPSEAAVGVAGPCTIRVWEDGIYKQIYGAMGTAVLNLPSGKACFLDCTYIGNWSAPAAEALPTPTYVTALPARFAASTAFTLNSVGIKASDTKVDLGNILAMREDATTATGFYTAFIGDREPKVTCDAETVRIATQGRHAAFTASTEWALSIKIFGSAGNFLTIAAPKAQIVAMPEGDRGGLQTDELTLQCNRATAPDDYLTLSFGAA